MGVIVIGGRGTTSWQKHWMPGKQDWQKVVWLRDVCPTLDSSVLFRNSSCASDDGVG